MHRNKPYFKPTIKRQYSNKPTKSLIDNIIIFSLILIGIICVYKITELIFFNDDKEKNVYYDSEDEYEDEYEDDEEDEEDDEEDEDDEDDEDEEEEVLYQPKIVFIDVKKDLKKSWADMYDEEDEDEDSRTKTVVINLKELGIEPKTITAKSL